MDNFLKAQIFIGIPTNITWALIVPLVAKLHGELWSVAAISWYFIAITGVGLFIPFFKVSLKQAYIINIILSGLYIIGSCIYFYSPTLFLIVELFLNSLLLLFGALYEIQFTVLLAKNYQKDIEEYEKYSYVRESLGSLIGFLMMAILYNYLNFDESLMLFIVLMVPTFGLGVWNYITYIREVADG